MKKSFKILTGIIAAIMLLALIMAVPPIADKVGGMIGWTGDKVESIAKTVLMIGLGAFLITSGIAALAVPVLGIALIVVGVGLLAFAVWPLFDKDDEDPKNPD